MSASPLCQVKDGAGAYQQTTAGGVNVTPGDTITAGLVQTAGVRLWAIACIGTDDTQVAATVTAGLTIDSVNKLATFTAPTAGSGLIFLSTVTDFFGVTSSTTFGVYTLLSGLQVAAQNETIEGNTVFGWCKKFNAVIRAIAAPAFFPIIPWVQKVGPYTFAGGGDPKIKAITTSGVTFTAPSTPVAGEIHVLKNRTGGNCTLAANTGQTIEGAASVTIADKQAYTFSYDLTSTDWTIE